MRYGQFSKYHILAKLIYVLRNMVSTSEPLIVILNVCTTDRRGNLPFALTRTLGLFWF